MINLDQFKKYQVTDTECLKGGYWSYQWRNENMGNANMIEIRDDQKAIKFYRNLKKCNRSIYTYSYKYDQTMINAFLKLVEKRIDNIPIKLRKVNDYLIQGNLNYFKINREFWCNHYFKLEDDIEDRRELFEVSIDQTKKVFKDPFVSGFLDEFPYLLGQSPVFKTMNFVDIPIMLYYYSIRKDGIIRPSISLKNIQLYEEGYNLTHDWEIDNINDFSIEEYENFKKYSLNDVDFLFRYFEQKCLPVIETRISACKAIQKFKPDFEVTEKMIHSETNTMLLVNAFSVDKKEINVEEENIKDEQMFEELEELTELHNGHYEVKDTDIIPHGDSEFIKSFNMIIEKYDNDKPKIGIDFKSALEDKKLVRDLYSHIKPTGYQKFDDFVEFIRNNSMIKNDKKLKELYCEEYDLKYNDEGDKTIEHDGQYSHMVGKFDTFNLLETMVTIGTGGIHGAKENIIRKNVRLLDYQSLYSSVLLQHRKHYESTINCDLYDALYQFRNYDVKTQIAELEKKIKELEDKESLIVVEEEKEKTLEILTGAKLLLNTLYGILNSEFSLSISNKILGRFICLYGQYRAIELCKRIKKYSPDSELININTDGVAVTNLSDKALKKIIDEDREGYLILDVKEIDKVIQNDVNNYLAIKGDSIKPKGTAFKSDIKQAFCRFEKLPCNIINALKYINNETNIEILPILFHQKNKNKSTINLMDEESSRNKLYYLTNKDKGKLAIKNIAHPIILSLDGELMYFTENKDDADIREYMKFARITQNRILEFRMNEKDNIPYYPYKLQAREDEKLVKEINSVKLKLNKLMDSNLICLTGFRGDRNSILTTGNKPIKELSNYTFTQIRKSSEVMAIYIINEFLPVSTNDEELIKLLNPLNTFTIEHISGKKLYIFENNQESINILMDMKDKFKFNILDQDTYKLLPVYDIDNNFKPIINNIENLERYLKL